MFSCQNCNIDFDNRLIDGNVDSPFDHNLKTKDPFFSLEVAVGCNEGIELQGWIRVNEFNTKHKSQSCTKFSFYSLQWVSKD